MNSRLRSACVLLPILLAACAPPSSDADERPVQAAQAFTSGEAVLVDFEFDGRVEVDAPTLAAARPLVEVQLMYLVGQLNGERALGRYEGLELSNLSHHATAAGRFELSYHARLPVAWGGTSVPTAYAVTLPARVGQEDQTLFAASYGTTCVDASVGAVSAEAMFLHYRPRRSGCELAPADVVTSEATVHATVANTTAKYPEYDRIWKDGALHVTAVFSRDRDDSTGANDDGALAYEAFLAQITTHLTALQPDENRLTTTKAAGATTKAKLSAILPDGRTVAVDVALVGTRLVDEGPSFDAWYDASTPAADVILYNGHAGRGENVRTLLGKGSFRPAQYVILAVNGCNTFAYVDASLAERRALLNPDDPRGTRYMDVISNVMAGYFDTTPDLSMSIVSAVIAAGAEALPDAPATTKTYAEIFASIDPEQVVVVTGDEDNTFQPAPAAPAAPAPAVTSPEGASKPVAAEPQPEPRADDERQASCSTGGKRGSSPSVVALLCLAALASRRSRKRSSSASTSGPK